MKLSELNKHWKIINEKNLEEKEIEKIHLIKFDFKEPTEEKVNTILKNFPSTNRYIISNNIKQYNEMLRGKKKYYVMNTSYMDLISFAKKNNKIILNVHNLKDFEYDFILKNPIDILRNIECIIMNRKEYKNVWESILEDWNGNILLID